MKSQELKERLEKAEATVEKRKLTIERHKKAAEKKLQQIKDRGWEPDRSLYQNKRDNESWEAYWAVCEYEYKLDALEAIRALDTKLSDLYMVEIPVITCWVRDSNYVPETREIYLTEPDLKDFLHCFRHHLQNIERRYERRGLTTEGNQDLALLPYQDCIYKLRGEDDAVAWSTMLLEVCR